jgi:hypothetical protein
MEDSKQEVVQKNNMSDGVYPIIFENISLFKILSYVIIAGFLIAMGWPLYFLIAYVVFSMSFGIVGELVTKIKVFSPVIAPLLIFVVVVVLFIVGIVYIIYKSKKQI